MRLFSCGCVLFIALAGCGGDDAGDYNSTNIVTPTEPKGTVAGIVRNAVDDTALGGVRVSLFGGADSAEATSNERGEFGFGPINAGAAFSLRFDAQGYPQVTLSNLSIDDAAGNFPTANGSLFVGPIAIVPTGGTYAVQVVDDQGAPVQNANVVFEVSPRYSINGVVGGSAEERASSDIDGLARATVLPDVRALGPRYTTRLTISVAPIDMNGDGVFELRGDTVTLDDQALREGATVPVVIMRTGGDDPLRVVASNLGTLIDRTGAFPVVDLSESIRVVFNKTIERESIAVDLRDETGDTTILSPFVLSASGNIITIDPAEDFQYGREYNISITASSLKDGVRETFNAATPFFARVDGNAALAITGRFRDVNGNQAWGDGDVLEFTATVPIGRPRGNGGTASMWVALDLNGSAFLGDAQGELPGSGQNLPAPITISLAEPSPGNGAGTSGLTRYFGAVPISMPAPIGSAQGGAAFEIRIEGDPLADISGRLAPERTTGTALLQ